MKTWRTVVHMSGRVDRNGYDTIRHRMYNAIEAETPEEAGNSALLQAKMDEAGFTRFVVYIADYGWWFPS